MKAKQYPEQSTDRCREACKIDLSCTGGHHWHFGGVCLHFGVEGAVDGECEGRTVGGGQSHGFDCRASPGTNLNVLNADVKRMLICLTVCDLQVTIGTIDFLWIHKLGYAHCYNARSMS